MISVAVSEGSARFAGGCGAQARAGVALDDRARLPWRFLARHMTVDGILTGAPTRPVKAG
jgi:hypothetical protein